MKKTLVWVFDKAPIDSIEMLSKNKIIDIKYFVSNIKIEGRENDFILPDDIYSLKQIKKDYKLYMKNIEFNKDIYDEVYKDVFRFINLHSRWVTLKLTEGYTNYVHLFNIFYNYFYSIIRKEQIELIIFANLPHVGIDLIIYNIAKALNIRTIILSQSIFPNKAFYMEAIEDYGNFELMQKIDDNINYKIAEQVEIPFYMKNISNFNKKKNLFLKSLFLRFRVDQIYGISRYLRHYLTAEYKNNLQTIIEDVDYTKSYVYFPLHMQPEMTTSILGKEYNDQILAIEALSSSLPKDWVIYIKENPKQSYYFRENLFFERLALLDNVKITPLEENSFKLIKHSQFVATITGTAGWEAIQMGVPTLVFGHTWYQNFEGVFKFDKKISITEVAKYKIDKEKLEKDVSNLLNRCANIIIGSGYERIYENYDHHINIKNTAIFLEKLINDPIFLGAK